MTTRPKVIVVTGASSGFGNLTARSLAEAGHIVYAGIRTTTSRNAPAVAALAASGRSAACGSPLWRWTSRCRSRSTPRSAR